jgi:hypothetical protein
VAPRLVCSRIGTPGKVIIIIIIIGELLIILFLFCLGRIAFVALQGQFKEVSPRKSSARSTTCAAVGRWYARYACATRLFPSLIEIGVCHTAITMIQPAEEELGALDHLCGVGAVVAVATSDRVRETRVPHGYLRSYIRKGVRHTATSILGPTEEELSALDDLSGGGAVVTGHVHHRAEELVERR